jgi:hypothetical protein
VIAAREQREQFERVLSCLEEFNAGRAKDAPHRYATGRKSPTLCRLSQDNLSKTNRAAGGPKIETVACQMRLVTLAGTEDEQNTLHRRRYRSPSRMVQSVPEMSHET